MYHFYVVDTTTEQNLLCCRIHAEDSFVLWDKTEEKLSWCGIQWEKTSGSLDTTEENSSGNVLKLFCGVSHTATARKYCTVLETN